MDVHTGDGAVEIYVLRHTGILYLLQSRKGNVVRIRMVSFVFFVCLCVGLTTLPVHAEQRCFPETGFCIDGKIRAFWEKNGGLAVFGFPTGGIEHILSEDKAITMQRFERNRIELHPWNAAPYDVQLGRLGDTKLKKQQRDWFAFPTSAAQPGCRFFVETNHNVCGDILAAWRKNGLQLDKNPRISEAESLALFGLPLSDLVTETLSDGKEYQVQWFERARFELHPENAPPYNVLLGLLGNETGTFGLTYNPDKFLDLSDADATGDDKPLTAYLYSVDEFAVGSSQSRNNYDKVMIEGVDVSKGLDQHFRFISPNSVPGISYFTEKVVRTRTTREAHELFTAWYNIRLSEEGENQTANVLEFVPDGNGVDEIKGFCSTYSYTVMPAGTNIKLEECDMFTIHARKGNLLLRLIISPTSSGWPSTNNPGQVFDFAKRLVERFAQ